MKETQERVKSILLSFPIPKKIPLSVAFGTVVIAVFWVLVIISWSLFDGIYNPLVNWMSDLGSSVLNPRGAIFFNIGCIVSGILLFPFFIGLYEWYIGSDRNKRLTKYTQVAGFFSAFFFIMIGVFTEDTIELHMTFAMLLFTVNVLTLVLPAMALYQFSFTRNIAKFAIVVLCINLTLFVLITPLVEWITITTSFMFIGLLIQNMNKRIDKYRFVRKSGIELPKTKKQREKIKKKRAKADAKAAKKAQAQ